SLGGAPSANAIACGAPSSLRHVTDVPGATTRAAGANAKFAIETAPGAAAVPADAAGWTTTLRGALPTAIVFVPPLARSTTVRSFEPSFVTHTVLPSDAIQCGCLPTAIARSAAFVAGSKTSSSPGPWTTTAPTVAPSDLPRCGDAPV